MEATQPHDWKGLGPVTPWESPEGGEGAENRAWDKQLQGMFTRSFWPVSRTFPPCSGRELDMHSPCSGEDGQFQEGQGLSSAWEQAQVTPQWGMAQLQGAHNHH